MVPGMWQTGQSTHRVRMQYFRSVCLCTDLVLSLCRYILCWCARGAQSLTGTSYCGGQSAFLLREGTIPRWVSTQTLNVISWIQNVVIQIWNGVQVKGFDVKSRLDIFKERFTFIPNDHNERVAGLFSSGCGEIHPCDGKLNFQSSANGDSAVWVKQIKWF